MSAFAAYLELGFTHITDLAGYDHMLFLIALCAAFQLAHWRRVLALVTAFTLGHSATLALSVLAKPILPTDTIEFLIPVTIVVTCLYNIFAPTGNSSHRIYINYALALLFGLVHGLGFSNYLRMLLGAEDSILQPLLAFNIGLELGQILIVTIILSIAALILRFLPISMRAWTIAWSIFAGTVAVHLAWGAWPV